MRLLKYMLPLLVLLIGSAAVSADYDPTSPPEPGVNFTLTTRCEPEGAGYNLTPTALHAFGSNVRINAMTRNGFIFLAWVTPDDEVVSETPDFNYIMPARDVELIAKYNYDPSDPEEPGTPEFKEWATIRFSKSPADAGSVSYYDQPSGSNQYPAETKLEVGRTIVLTASTNSKYDFVNWTCDGVVMAETRRWEYTVEAGTHEIVANFQYNPDDPEEPGENMFVRTLTVKANPEEAARVYGGGTYNYGQSVRVYESVNKYYTFINWTDDLGEVVSTSRDFYYTIPNREVTLTANYSYNYDPDSPEEPGEPIPPGSIAENMVAYPRFGMYDDTHVMILCETEGSTIYYTIDGSDPTEESTVYTEPVFVPSNVVVKAIAFKEGMDHSPIRSYQVTAYRTAAPKFTFVNRKIEMTSETAGASIFYTLDFSEPTPESTRYTAGIEPEENCRIKAMAISPGLTDSEVSIFVYRRADYTLDAPTFSLNGEGQLVITPPIEGGETYYTYSPEGEEPTYESTRYSGPITLDGNGIIRAFTYHINYFDSPVSDYEVTGFVVARPTLAFTNPMLSFSTATRDASIRYTTDGSIPTEEAALYENPLRLTEDCKVTARGFKANYESSDTISFTYLYRDYMLPTPTASFENKVLTLTCEDPDAQIHYTIDDSAPGEESTLYTAPIALTEDCTVRFIATRENFNPSDEGSFVFVYTAYRVATPDFSYDNVNKLLAMSCSTEDAEIRYTSNGSEPTAESTLYENPVEVVGNLTFNARAFKTGFFDSAVASLAINDQSVPTPTASFANKQLTLTCSDADAAIYYTIDGTAPTSSSTLYEEPVALTEDCTVKFIAARENFNNSPEGTFDFVRSYYSAATPVFSYDREAGTITITTETENAEIRYTTDGSVPESNTGSVYTAPINVTSNLTYTARSFRSDLFDSEAATLRVDNMKVPNPVASFANRVLTLTCPDNQAQIRYTTDGTEPTATSTLYESPISLTADCTVRFIAIRENLNNSDVMLFQFEYAAYRVATPTFSYDPTNKTVTMACATADAVIRYTTDGTAPTAASTQYRGAITVNGNMTITARAFRSDLFDSEIATLAINDQKVATPTATYANKQLTLACSDDQAQIRYTTDGSAPTANSTLYDGPIALSADCTVRFIAVRANYNNSDEGSFNFSVAQYTVATPTITYNSADGTVTITCTTENAQIRYTTDGTEPTATTGTVYSGPITVEANMTVTARAFRSDLFDSAINSEVVDDKKVTTPTASYAAHAVTLSCADPDAAIRYTTDNTTPTAASTLYTAPIPVSADVTIHFIAVKANLNNSDQASYEFRLADYKEEKPEVKSDYLNRKLTVTHPVSTGVKVTIGNATTNHSLPATLDVTPDMTQVSVVALASNADRFDSDATVENIFFHLPPVITFNGKRLTVAPNPDDSNKEGVTRNVTFNGATMSNDVEDVTFDVQEFGTVTAFIASDAAFYSETATRRIDFFNTGTTAGARNGHSISEAFGGHGDSLSDYEELTVVGEIGTKDLSFLTTLPALTTVTLAPETFTTESCDGALSGARIETITLPVAPEGILKGMPRLTSVVWSAAEAMPEGRITEAGNPNLLLWVNAKELAPSDAPNVVVNGAAEKIVLHPGYPFNACEEFTAGSIELTKTFDLATEIGVCQGWETIALPFTPTRIHHASKGDVTPFAAWDGSDDSPKPFWLYKAASTGWDEATEIEAGTPYIISMPNNPEYIEAFNLNGNITFAAEKATISPDMALSTSWVEGMTFKATFMPVEGSVHSLNSRGPSDSETLPGSVFTEEAETLPFEAYVVNAGSRRRIPLFGDWSDVTLPTLSPAGVVVEALGGGKVRISSGREFTAEIYTLTGMKVRSAHIAPGESVIIDGLAKGIYIIAGSKISIN